MPAGERGQSVPQAPIEGLSLGRALLARRENTMYIFPGNAPIFEKTFKSGHFWAPQNDVGGRTLGGRQQDLGTLWLSRRNLKNVSGNGLFQKWGLPP